ncbi:hypothetical protein AQPE_2631 [Aquipluma nitroreducens]|uniref:Uncharacterized protein n=1 Tax=Aquipluma nitroreducens TaxID=2010828 RepID=A0A5K7SAG9_9BACT|nr:hypothetical protein AQPE_2631 [Aquipluma nitroreducens]
MPTIRLSLCDLKYDPCPQSWKIMKSRTKKPAAKRIRKAVSQYETERL